MLNSLNLENIGVKLIEQGTYSLTFLEKHSSLILYLVGLIIFSVVLSFVLLKYKKYKGNEVCKLSLSGLIASLMFFFIGFIIYTSFGVDFEAKLTTKIENLRTDECIIEFTETTDYYALNSQYSVYKIGDIVVAREGKNSCNNKWLYPLRTLEIEKYKENDRPVLLKTPVLSTNTNDLNEIGLNHLGVIVEDMGSYTASKLHLFILFIFLILFIIFVYFIPDILNKYQNTQIYKKVELNISITMFVSLLIILVLFFTALIIEGQIYFSPSKHLSELRKDEYIIEFTENTDYYALTTNFSVYMLEDKIVCRDGYSTNQWNYAPTTDEMLK